MRSTKRPRRGLILTRRRGAAIVVTGLALAGTVTAVNASAAGPSRRPSAPTTAPSAPSAPASTCPTGALAFSSTLSNGSMKIGRVASVTGGSAKACGLISAGADGALTSTVDKANVTFAPTQTSVLILKLPTTVVATGNLSGPVSLAADGQHVTLTGPVAATASLLGAKCTLNLTPALTTDTSRKLKGQPLTDDGTGTGTLKGKLVADDFAVPAIKATRECPALIAAMENMLLGLPLAKGQSSITFDITLKLGA